MIVTFTGTGEACDPQRRNSSILLETAGCRYLLDCGFSSGAVSFSGADQAPLTSVWFSHFHGDHFFGIPQLLLMLYTQKRAAPLTILSGTDCREILYHTINLAYPGLTEKLPFPLMFIQLSPGRPKAHQGLLWQTVPVAHTAEAFALRVSDQYHSIYYSGDGKPTPESMDVMRGCALVIHEAFSYKPTDPGHGSIDECLQLAAQLALPRLALIHINRETRAMLDRGEKKIQTPPGTELFIPEDGETVILQAPQSPISHVD